MLVTQLLLAAAFAEPELPVPVAARPPTLPQSAVRIDADTVIGVQPGSNPTGDLTAGFGIGVTDDFELGADVLPLDLAPTVAYGSPSVYGAYSAPIGEGVALVPQARVFVPVTEGSRALLDAAAELMFQGRDVQVSVIPETSLSFLEGGVESSFAAPVELTVQPHRRVFLTLDSGVSTDPLDPRYNAPREDLAEGWVVPFGGGIGTTLGRVNEPVTDLSLAAYWPRLAQFSDEATTHAEDFAVIAQIQGIIPTDSTSLRTGRAGRRN
jgi:hypothetical protein